MVRVPRDLAVLFAQDATRAGISQSDRMAEILTALYAGSLRGLLCFPSRGIRDATWGSGPAGRSGSVDVVLEQQVPVGDHAHQDPDDGNDWCHSHPRNVALGPRS
jgi:hypothetical protein